MFNASEDAAKTQPSQSAAVRKFDPRFEEGWEAAMGYEKYDGPRADWLPEGWREAIAKQKWGRRKVFIGPTGTSRWDRPSVLKAHEKELSQSRTSSASPAVKKQRTQDKRPSIVAVSDQAEGNDQSVKVDEKGEDLPSEPSKSEQPAAILDHATCAEQPLDDIEKGEDSFSDAEQSEGSDAYGEDSNSESGFARQLTAFNTGAQHPTEPDEKGVDSSASSASCESLSD